MRTNLIAGLDIGTTKTCAVIGELPDEPGRASSLRVLGVGQTRTAGMRGERVTLRIAVGYHATGDRRPS